MNISRIANKHVNSVPNRTWTVVGEFYHRETPQVLVRRPLESSSVCTSRNNFRNLQQWQDIFLFENVFLKTSCAWKQSICIYSPASSCYNILLRKENCINIILLTLSLRQIHPLTDQLRFVREQARIMAENRTGTSLFSPCKMGKFSLSHRSVFSLLSTACLAVLIYGQAGVWKTRILVNIAMPLPGI